MTKKPSPLIQLWNDHNSLQKLCKSLKKDEVSITSTDTTLGLLANTTRKGFSALNNIKGRQEKPYLILVWPQSKIEHFVDKKEFDSHLKNFIGKCWPGPVTIICKAKQGLPAHLVSKSGKIAFRCPKHKGLQEVLSHFTGLFSTSANKANQKTANNIKTIDPDIVRNVRYIIVDTINFLYKTLPSSIIDVSDRKAVRVVREGSFPISELEQFYGSKFKYETKP